MLRRSKILNTTFSIVGDCEMSATWQTKYGSRRVRHDPPTLAEALSAAEGLTDDQEQQAIIAAELMGVPAIEGKAELKGLAPDHRRSTLTMVAPMRDKGARTIVVERKASRRFLTPPQRTASASLRNR